MTQVGGGEGAGGSGSARRNSCRLRGRAGPRPSCGAAAYCAQEWDHYGARVPLTVLWIDDCQVTRSAPPAGGAHALRRWWCQERAGRLKRRQLKPLQAVFNAAGKGKTLPCRCTHRSTTLSARAGGPGQDGGQGGVHLAAAGVRQQAGKAAARHADRPLPERRCASTRLQGGAEGRLRVAGRAREGLGRGGTRLAAGGGAAGSCSAQLRASAVPLCALQRCVPCRAVSPQACRSSASWPSAVSRPTRCCPWALSCAPRTLWRVGLAAGQSGVLGGCSGPGSLSSSALLRLCCLAALLQSAWLGARRGWLPGVPTPPCHRPPACCRPVRRRPGHHHRQGLPGRHEAVSQPERQRSAAAHAWRHHVPSGSMRCALPRLGTAELRQL